MSAPGPYREQGERESAAVVSRRPIRWKVAGLVIMASAGTCLAANLLAAFALNFGRAESVGEAQLRWIAVLCIVQAAVGAIIAACAELRGGP